MADEKDKRYSVQDVNAAFKAWKVPTEEDFAGLITLAESTPLIGGGLGTPSTSTEVQLQCAPNGGLDSSAAVGAWVKCTPNGGLTTKHSGALDVRAGGGLTFDPTPGEGKDALKLNLADEGKGPLVDDQAKGLHLKVDHGLSCDSGSLTLKTNPAAGLQVVHDITTDTYSYCVNKFMPL